MRESTVADGSPMGGAETRESVSFLLTKHSWRGKLRRVFSIGPAGIVTSNPQTLEVTNRWPFSDVFSVQLNPRVANEFNLTVRKEGNKRDTMRFSTDYRAEVLVESFRFWRKFAELPMRQARRINAIKMHWSGQHVPVILEIAPGSLDQFDPATNHYLSSYPYTEIQNVTVLSDFSQPALALSVFSYMKLYGFMFHDASSRDQLVQAMQEAAAQFVGSSIKVAKEPLNRDMFMDHKYGRFSADESLTCYAEFTVTKLSTRLGQSVRRHLGLSDSCLIERDPATYHIVSLKPLADIVSLVRDPEDQQKFIVEFLNYSTRTYLSTERDALLASIVDGVRGSGNLDIFVRKRPSPFAYRLGFLRYSVEEEVESQHLKFIQQPPSNMTWLEVLMRFNANVAYSGLLHSVTQEGIFAENKEKLIQGALNALMQYDSFASLTAQDGAGGNAPITLAPSSATAETIEAEFHAFRRLLASKAGFLSFTRLRNLREFLGIKVVKAVRSGDDSVAHAAIDMINCIMAPMHADFDLRQEQLNKSSILSSKAFIESLLDIFIVHIQRQTGALYIAAILDLLTFSLSPPYSETTDATQFDTVLELAANCGRELYRLFQHPSVTIVKGAGLVVKAMIEESEEDISNKMQELALAEGALPRHLLTALFTIPNSPSDTRALASRQLSRHLVAIWATGNEMATAMIRRIFPAGLADFLLSTDPVPLSEQDKLYQRDNLKNAMNQGRAGLLPQFTPHLRQIERHLDGLMLHWRVRLQSQWNTAAQAAGVPQLNVSAQPPPPKPEERPVVLRKRRQQVKVVANWEMFFYQFLQDHARPNLIWNLRTRTELRQALENEIRGLQADVELSGPQFRIAWNYAEFAVNYECLKDEIKIGDYYLRLLLEEEDASEAGQILKQQLTEISRAKDFFNDVYHRFLIATKTAMKCLCLQALAIIYGRCHDDIGPFSDTRFVVSILSRSFDRQERDRLIIFLSKLMLNRENAREFIDESGIRVLVDLVTLAHLHIQRATVPLQSNVLEAGPNSKKDAEKEWFYLATTPGTNAEQQQQQQSQQQQQQNKVGPLSWSEMKELCASGQITNKTQVWVPGLPGWRPATEVPQIRWSLLAQGTAVFTESELAAQILSIFLRILSFYPSRDTFDAVIRPVAKARQILSDPTCLPHIVQLLLTFDPVLVERTTSLLHVIVQDNPILPRFYLSGVFFFILMYTGSNVLPMANLLKYTHIRQAFRAEDKKTDLLSRSILSPLLPEAMVYYLENYTVEEFAKVYLGEFDTPEAIWNADMRRFLIQKIALHLSDFTPRLLMNTRLPYPYCAIPYVVYPQLQRELFCGQYYLRHLCDTTRFPDWPIRDPVSLLKSILEAWRSEVEKKPSSMTAEDALDALKLDRNTNVDDYSAIRRAYYRLAQKYHPDKNPSPEAREIFETVNKAYEFLCSRERAQSGPDINNISVILRAQSILFSRYGDVLRPYKYAGYTQLIATIELETNDDRLFSKGVPLLADATELAYHTMNCSALNAEELRRENGLASLQKAFSRCVSVLSKSTNPDDTAALVCMHVARCYGVAASFPAGRLVMYSDPTVVVDLCRALYFSHLTRLCCAVADAFAVFSESSELIASLLNAGALFHLLVRLFDYDYTLEEGGVEKSNDKNKQELANQLARSCLTAAVKMAGYQIERDSVQLAHLDVRKCVRPMLTTYVCQRAMNNADPNEILKLLNSNSETPVFIWNNMMRVELMTYLGNEQQRKIRTGECDPSFGATFEFSQIKDELVVGDVFLRVYNEQPTFIIEDPRTFALRLLDYIGTQMQYVLTLESIGNSPAVSSNSGQITSNGVSTREIDPTMPNLPAPLIPVQVTGGNQNNNNRTASPAQKPLSPTSQLSTTLTVEARMLRVEAALESLRNVLTHNAGCEAVCIGHFRLILSLLLLTVGSSKLHLLTVEIINRVANNADCVADISASEMLHCLLLATHATSAASLAGLQLLLETLAALMASSKIVKEAIAKGGLVYFLDVFINNSSAEVRTLTATLLSRMLADKLHGPRVRILLAKFLPPVFADAVRDAPESAVHLFDNNQENPELIWNDENRRRVTNVVSKLSHELLDKQRRFNVNPADLKWDPTDSELAPILAELQDEVTVAGVYLRLYLQNPGWILRRPREFLIELIEKWMAEAENSQATSDLMETLTRSVVVCLATQPGLVDQMPGMGHFPRIVSLMNSVKSQQTAAACLRILLPMAGNHGCATAFSQQDSFIGAVKNAMRTAKTSGISSSAETLSLLFAFKEESFGAQALRTEFIPFLLRILEVPLQSVDNSAAVKAHIANALKALQTLPINGPAITEQLDKSPVWRDYRDQRHDLFIADTPKTFALAAPTVAGYLTAARNTQSPSVPHLTSADAGPAAIMAPPTSTAYNQMQPPPF